MSTQYLYRYRIIVRMIGSHRYTLKRTVLYKNYYTVLQVSESGIIYSTVRARTVSTRT